MTSEKNDDDVADETVERIAAVFAGIRKVDHLPESEVKFLRSNLRQAKVFYENAISLPSRSDQQRDVDPVANAMRILAKALSTCPPALLRIAAHDFEHPLPHWAGRDLLLYSNMRDRDQAVLGSLERMA